MDATDHRTVPNDDRWAAILESIEGLALLDPADAAAPAAEIAHDLGEVLDSDGEDG